MGLPGRRTGLGILCGLAVIYTEGLLRMGRTLTFQLAYLEALSDTTTQSVPYFNSRSPKTCNCSKQSRLDTFDRFTASN